MKGISRSIAWLRLRLSPTNRLFLLAVVVGLLAGAGAALLKILIRLVSKPLTHNFISDGINWWLLLIPIVGIILSGCYQRYILHTDIEHATRLIKHRVKAGEFVLPRWMLYAPIIASTITLGFGGSAGAEGPIATTGASIGSRLGKWLGLSPNTLRLLIACGAGAGIAGIFKAPLGGVMFTLEVLAMEMTTISVIALILSCIVAGMTAYALSGFTIGVPIEHHIAFAPHLYWVVILLGLFCGIYSVYYSLVMRNMETVYNRISNRWLRNLASGGILALLVFLFPALYGEGYDVLGKIVNGHTLEILNGSVANFIGSKATALFIAAGAILAVKCFACSASNSGGGVAGDFAPTLFAGAFAGLFFYLIFKPLLGIDIPVQVCALFAMAGVMAGAIRAPFMAIFITTELTATYDYFLPVTITALISAGVVRIISREPIYIPKY